MSRRREEANERSCAVFVLSQSVPRALRDSVFIGAATSRMTTLRVSCLMSSPSLPLAVLKSTLVACL